jgi:stalled ribosome rescue protein Dom34
MNIAKRSYRATVTSGIFKAYHNSILHLERSYHAAGVAVEFYEAVNEKMEKIILLVNSQTKTPYKSVAIEGKSPWQAIRDVAEQVQEQYGHEAPGVTSANLRAWITAQMNERCITETQIAKEAGCSLSLVTHFLKGRRSSPAIMVAVLELLGYGTIEELITAFRTNDPAPESDDEPSESFGGPLEAPRGHDGGGK